MLKLTICGGIPICLNFDQKLILWIVVEQPLQSHYENIPIQYTGIFTVVKNENFQWNVLTFCLGEAVLTCTHNLCFGAKIRKIGITLHTPVFLYKSVV